MLNEIATKRIQKELLDLDRDPPPGITCFPKDDIITNLEAYIQGPPDSPYQAGLFKLSIQIPDRYPFQPPQIKFITAIYHPNIDDTGRICADILKTGEKGQWKPAINLGTALTSLRQLLAAPNPDDPLDADIAKEYRLDYPTFKRNAIEFTEKYASKDAFNDEESVVQIQVEAMAIEEEEQVKRPKITLSLSKKKSLVAHDHVNNDSTVDRIESTQTKDTKSKENIEEKTLGEAKNTELGERTQKIKLGKPKKSNDNVEKIHTIDRAIVTQKLELGKSKKVESDSRDKSSDNIVKKVHTIDKAEKVRSNHKDRSSDDVEKVNTIDKAEPESKGKIEKTQKLKLGKSKKDKSDSGDKRSDSIEKVDTEVSVKGKAKMEKEIRMDTDECSMTMDVDKETVMILSEDDSEIINNEPRNNKRPLDASFFNQNIIELSDTDDDLFNQPVFHSLQLSKKLKRNKLSLSKKRRS